MPIWCTYIKFEVVSSTKALVVRQILTGAFPSTTMLLTRFLLLILNTFHTLLWYFHCLLWTNKCQLGSIVIPGNHVRQPHDVSYSMLIYDKIWHISLKFCKFFTICPFPVNCTRTLGEVSNEFALSVPLSPLHKARFENWFISFFKINWTLSPARVFN